MSLEASQHTPFWIASYVVLHPPARSRPVPSHPTTPHPTPSSPIYLTHPISYHPPLTHSPSSQPPLDSRTSLPTAAPRSPQPHHTPHQPIVIGEFGGFYVGADQTWQDWAVSYMKKQETGCFYFALNPGSKVGEVDGRRSRR